MRLRSFNFFHIDYQNMTNIIRSILIFICNVGCLVMNRWVCLCTVNSGIEARLLFNFWTFWVVLYSTFCQFLLNKSLDFCYFFCLLFETVFYSYEDTVSKNATGNVHCTNMGTTTLHYAAGFSYVMIYTAHA